MTPQVLASNRGGMAVPATIRQPSCYSQPQPPSYSSLPTLRFCPLQPTEESIDFTVEKQLSCYEPSHRDRFLRLQAEADVLLNYLKQINQHRLQQAANIQEANHSVSSE